MSILFKLNFRSSCVLILSLFFFVSGTWAEALQFRSDDEMNNSLVAAGTNFIEIQAPMIDARYLDWFMQEALAPILLPSLFLGADWGLDMIFCAAAADYSVRFLNYTMHTEYMPIDTWTKWAGHAVNKVTSFCCYASILSYSLVPCQGTNYYYYYYCYCCC
jgi:hypothetical protein